MKIWAILIRCANCVLISRQQLKSINIITLHVVWKFDISPPTPPSHFSLYVWCCVLPAFLLTFLLHSPFLRSSHEHDQLLMAFSQLLLVFASYFHRESSLYLFYIIHQIFVHKSSCTLDVGMIFVCVCAPNIRPIVLQLVSILISDKRARMKRTLSTFSLFLCNYELSSDVDYAKWNHTSLIYQCALESEVDGSWSLCIFSFVP